MDARQEQVFAQVAHLLDGLKKPAEVGVVPAGWKARDGWWVPWPLGEDERSYARKALLETLRKLGCRATVQVKVEGVKQRWRFPWSEWAGLFDPPERESSEWADAWLDGRTPPVSGKPCVGPLRGKQADDRFEVTWPGFPIYRLTAGQRRAVRLLIKAYAERGEGVPDQALLHAACVRSGTVEDLFAGTGAYGQLVLPCEGGRHRIAEPRGGGAAARDDDSGGEDDEWVDRSA